MFSATRPNRLTRLFTLCGLAAAAAAAPSSALAQPDRINDTPAGWTYGYTVTGASLDTGIASNLRPIALNRVSANSFDAITVVNSGEYAVPGFSSAHTFYEVSPATLSANLSGRRIIDLECAGSGASTVVSAITVPNAGPMAASGWGWLYNQSSVGPIVDWVEDAATPIRILDLEKYEVNGQTRWAAVAVNNDGEQAQGWWWYFGQTSSQVTALLTQNSARLIDIVVQAEPTLSTPATFAVVMVSENPGGGWWHPGLTSTQVAAMHNQNGARLTVLERYQGALGQTLFAVAMVDNANDQTRRMRSYMDSSLDNGTYGFMLKEVGGPVLAGLNTDFAFEPASMLKILHGARAIRQCSIGADSLTANVNIRDTCNNNECPSAASPCSTASEDLQVAIREMLEQSDNNRTMEIELRYGRAQLNTFAGSLGLDSTQINHTLGCLCGNPFNTFSCTDAVGLYEQIADGSLFNQSWQDVLYSLMLDLDNQGYGIYPTLSSVITQEAASTNLTASEITAFRNAVRFANKGGGYSCNGTFYRTEGGWASIPFKVEFLGTHITVNREYALATFVHGSTDDTGSRIAYSAKEEILREQIRAALRSWDTACTTPNFNNNPNTQTVDEGASVSLVTGHTGTAAAYLWQKSFNGGPWGTVANIAGQASGATTGTLTLINVNAQDQGLYRCVISSPCGNDTSGSASLTVTPACRADYNDSGSATVQDIFDFLADYLPGGPAGDFNNDGNTTVQDIFDFLTAYFAGCP